MTESFFSTPECELLVRRKFLSQAEARMACFGSIKGWCNPLRLHSARRIEELLPWNWQAHAQPDATVA